MSTTRVYIVVGEPSIRANCIASIRAPCAQRQPESVPKKTEPAPAAAAEPAKPAAKEPVVASSSEGVYGGVRLRSTGMRPTSVRLWVSAERRPAMPWISHTTRRGLVLRYSRLSQEESKPAAAPSAEPEPAFKPRLRTVPKTETGDPVTTSHSAPAATEAADETHDAIVKPSKLVTTGPAGRIMVINKSTPATTVATAGRFCAEGSPLRDLLMGARGASQTWRLRQQHHRRRRAPFPPSLAKPLRAPR